MNDEGNKDRNFRGQMKNEQVLCFCRKHWIYIFPNILLILLFWPAVIIFTFFFGAEGISNLLGVEAYRIFALTFVVLGTILFHAIFLKVFNSYLNIFVITNLRLIDFDKTVFFKDRRNAIDIKEIQDCTMYRSGFLQTVLNYGELKIVLSSASTPISIKYIPNPDYHFRKINKTKREYIVNRQFEKKTEKGFSRDREQKPLQAEGNYPLTYKDFYSTKATDKDDI